MNDTVTSFDEDPYAISSAFFDAPLPIGTLSISPHDLYSAFDSFVSSRDETGEQSAIGVADMREIVEGLSLLIAEGRRAVEEVLSPTIEERETAAHVQTFRLACTRLIEAFNARLGSEELRLSGLTFESLTALCLHYGRWSASYEQADEGAEILIHTFAVRLSALEDGDARGLIEITRVIGMRQLMPLIRCFDQEALEPEHPMAELREQLFRLTGQEAITPEDLIDILGHVQVQDLLKTNAELARREYEAFRGKADFEAQVETLEDAELEVEGVREIAEDERWFRVKGLDTPVRLNRALIHQFYSLVAKKKWWEALDLMQLSQRGDYRIAHKENADESLKLSVAIRIQKAQEENPENNLYPSPPFSHSDWSVECFDPKRLAQVIEAISDEGFSHLTEGIDLSKLIANPSNVEELMQSLISALGGDRMVETIRLTREDVSQEDYASTLIQIGDQLTQEGILAGIVMTETPYLQMFEQLGFLIGRPCIVPVASYRMRPQDKHETHQVLFFYPNENLLRNFLTFIQQTAKAKTKTAKDN